MECERSEKNQTRRTTILELTGRDIGPELHLEDT